jgi:cytochrome c2
LNIVLSLATISLIVALPACGSTDNAAGGPSSAGAPSSAGNPSSTGSSGTPTGSAANGATLFMSQSLACNTCHADDASGGIGPNISGSTTAGIGSWTYSDFHNAVRLGEDKSGTKKLCFLMIAIPATPSTAGGPSVSDQGIADIYAFLQTKKNDTVNHGTGGCNTQ